MSTTKIVDHKAKEQEDITYVAQLRWNIYPPDDQQNYTKVSRITNLYDNRKQFFCSLFLELCHHVVKNIP